MNEEKKKSVKTTEIDYPEIKEVEHTTTHPDPEQQPENLQNVHFSPGENSYLNERTNS
ncbi:hypothetical protein [Scopulibacillus cellulosilyticus]|uniref:Uncharacterized protein n=1 Tax=Scopulibacillus cellulosilyticus TaxID=2665665 RepID=A0ABW2PYD6_9BACL